MEESATRSKGGNADNQSHFSGPYEVAEIHGWDEAKHFELSGYQWYMLHRDGCACYWRPRMSIFTYRNKDSVNVEDILDDFQNC